MKLRNQIRKYAVGRKAALVGAVVALPAVFSSTANAAIDAAVTTQLTEVQADISTVGGSLILLAAVAMGYRWVKATFF